MLSEDAAFARALALGRPPYSNLATLTLIS